MKRNCHIKGLALIQFSNGTDFTLPGSTEDRYIYAYSYDSFGRLTESARFEAASNSPTNAFTERNISFDRNGNILTLTRYGNGNATIKDNFIYSYDGNQLKKLDGTFNGSAINHTAQSGGNTIQTPGTADYIYDGNGNMTLDALRNISLTYDINNLISTVSRNDTLLSTYHYLADGTKYKVIDPDNNGRVYIGPFSYTTAKSGNTVYSYLEGIDTDGGRIMIVRKQSGTQNTYDYTTAFFVRDHLGSTRVMLNAQGDILERNAYYPFGLQMNQGKAYPTLTERLPQLYSGYVSSTPARHDLYNGKELQTVAGTDYLDYGFRQYDQTNARWFNIDPKAQKYMPVTPYNYCAGNPISLVDDRGSSIDGYISRQTGRYLGNDMTPSNDIRVVDEKLYFSIIMNNYGKIGLSATLQLQKNSVAVNYSRSDINDGLKDMVDNSFSEGNEYNTFICLDTQENTIVLLRGPIGDNSHTDISLSYTKEGGAYFEEYGERYIIIASAHGHPLTNDKAKTNVSSVSYEDKQSAHDLKISIYAIDAFGEQPYIHSVSPNGTTKNKTAVYNENFDIVQDIFYH